MGFAHGQQLFLFKSSIFGVLNFPASASASDADAALLPPPQAGEEGQPLRGQLQEKLQWLVSNYAQKRASLLEEILPEVRQRVVLPAGW